MNKFNLKRYKERPDIIAKKIDLLIEIQKQYPNYNLFISGNVIKLAKKGNLYILKVIENIETGNLFWMLENSDNGKIKILKIDNINELLDKLFE